MSKRIGGVIVSHVRLANELLSAAEQVVGQLDHIKSVSIGWHDNVEAARDEIERAIDDVSEGNGVLLLTDMFGGTPSNMSLSFHDEHQVEVVTGMNLPMLIKLATLREGKPLDELAAFIKAYGQRNISVASELVPEGDL